MGFSRQEYWSGQPFPPPGDLPDPVIEPHISCIGKQSLYHCATSEAPYECLFLVIPLLFLVSTKQVMKLKVLLTELLTDAIMVKPKIIKTLNNKQPNLPTVGKLLKLRTVWPREAILFKLQKNPSVSGNSLVIQWLGLHAFIAEVRELRSCKLLGQKQKNKTEMVQYIIS